MAAKELAKAALRAALGRGASGVAAAMPDDAVLVTFDVFDTLVRRTCGAPGAVFDLVAEIWEREGRRPIPGFRGLREAAEREARRASGSNVEVSLEDIYSRLGAVRDEDRGDLMELELACELAVCEPDAEMVSLYDRLRSERRVAIVSDTYLPLWAVSAILNECGVSGYECLFVSSDRGAMKRDGRLFEAVLEETGVDASRAAHVGDHPLADWALPRKLGIAALLYRRCGGVYQPSRAIHRGAKGRLLAAAPGLKRSKVVRALTWPLMTARYALGDALYRGSPDSAAVAALRDLHRGGRCFVVGNGPSLTASDLDAIAGEVSFGANRVYNLFGNTSWRPTYYLAVDRDFLAEEGKLLAGVDAGTVMLHRTLATCGLEGRPRVVLLNAHARSYAIDYSSIERVAFSERPDLVVYPGFTVTYVALQLALWMGFSEIYLLGMDHNYSSRIEAGGVVVTDESVKDHVYAEAQGTVVNAWNTAAVEYAYGLAREEAGVRGVKIRNATRGGALEVFERADLDEVLKRIRSEREDV